MKTQAAGAVQFAPLVAAVALLVASPAALATPITISQFAVFRADRSADNPIGFSPTSFNVVAQTAPGPGGGTTVVVSTVDADGNVLQQGVAPVGAGVFSGQFISEFPYDAGLTNPWTLTATNGTDTATAFRQAFGPVDAMPFVGGIGFTGTNNDITIHWTVDAAAESRLDDQQVGIWDLTNPLAPVAVQFFSIGSAVRSVDLTGLDLVLGTPYAAEIQNVDRHAGPGTAIDVFSGTWLVGWKPTSGEVFVPVPEPATLSMLALGLISLGVARRARRSA